MTRRLIAMLLAAGAILGAWGTDYNDCIFAYYRFDNNLKDVSGNGNTLFLRGGELDFGEGINGASVRLSPLIGFGIDSNSTISRTFSIACWFKRTAGSRGGYLIYPLLTKIKRLESYASIGVIISDDGVRVCERIGDEIMPIIEHGAVIDSEWHHLAVVANKRTINLFMDGLLVESDLNLDRETYLMFGGNQVGGECSIGGCIGQCGFDGCLDELVIYTLNISSNTVRDLKDRRLPTSEEVSVSLDPNGGCCSTLSKTGHKGMAIGPLPVPNKVGYGFIGWFTEKVGGMLVNDDTVIDAETTWYAHWDSSGRTDFYSDVAKGKVVVSGDVAYISDGAFRNAKWLNELIISKDSCEISFSDEAMMGCDNLKSISILDDKQTWVKVVDGCLIGEVAVRTYGENFWGWVGSGWGNSLVAVMDKDCGEITVPNIVEYVSSGAFKHGKWLRSLIVPRTVLFSDSALEGCENLANVQIAESTDDSLEHEQCGDLRINNGCLIGTVVNRYSYDGITDSLITVYKKNSGDIKIPSDVLHVSEGAFKGAGWLKSLELNSNVVFADAAFEGCTALTRVRVNASDSKQVLRYEGGCLIGKVDSGRGGTNALIAVINRENGHLTIPSSVEYVAIGALRNATWLKNMTVPNHVIFADEGLVGCSSLKKVTVVEGHYPESDSPMHVENGMLIGRAYEHKEESVACNDLLYVVDKKDVITIPAIVQYVSGSVFSNAAWVKTIKFTGDDIIAFSDVAFKGCYSLTNVEGVGEYAEQSPTGLFIENECLCGKRSFGGKHGIEAVLTVLDMPRATGTMVAPEILDCSAGALYCATWLKTLRVDYMGMQWFSGEAFSGCDKLVEVNIVDNEASYLSVDGVCLIGQAENDSGGGDSRSLLAILGEKPVFTIRFDASGGYVDESSRSVEKGKSLGALPEPNRDKYKFLGWYTAKDGGTKVTATTKVTADVTYYAHWEYDGSAMVTVSVAEGCEAMGKVTGGNATFKVGAKVSLKATANKGYVFSRWEKAWTGEQGTGNGSELLSQSASFTYVATGEPIAIVAVFVPTGDDAESLKVEVADDVPTEADGSLSLDLGECVESLSQPKLMVSGLPSGLKYDAKTGIISGKATKPGAYTVKVTASNASATGKKAVVETFNITVPNLRWNEETVGVALEDKYLLQAGVTPALSDEVAAITGAGWKLAVSGLPSGVKFDAKKGMLSGIATKEGFYTVYFTATRGKGKTAEKEVATATFEVVFPTLALSMSAWGDASATNKCKVAGGGRYPFGKKVTLKATPDKGKVFMGWCDGEGELVAQTASYSYVTTAEDVTFTAMFATAEEDKGSIALAVDGTEMRLAGDGSPYQTNIWAGVYLEWPVAASALSEPKVKVSGLPSGLKFTDKPVTSKIGSGKTAVTVTNVPANTIYGAPTAASKIDTKTGAAKPSVVKFTVTTAGKSTQTYQIDTVVDALPAWAVGTFSGGWETEDAVASGGQVSLTVDAKGKVSGKALGDGLTYTLAAPYYAGFEMTDGVSNFLADVTATWSYKEGTKTVKTNDVVQLIVQDNGVGGYAAVEDWFEAYTVNWKVEPWKTLGKSFDKNTLTYAILSDGSFSEDEDVLTSALGEEVVGRVTLKFAVTGAVTIAGEFVTGYNEKTKKYTTVKATGSATLVPVDDERGAVFIYLTPKGLTPHARCMEVRLPQD